MDLHASHAPNGSQRTDCIGVFRTLHPKFAETSRKIWHPTRTHVLSRAFSPCSSHRQADVLSRHCVFCAVASRAANETNPYIAAEKCNAIVSVVRSVVVVVGWLTLPFAVAECVRVCLCVCVSSSCANFPQPQAQARAHVSPPYSAIILRTTSP